ncbi:hypothetical protein BDP27DRAFT_1388596 [Rhodocollybia butyracea]|uniref:DUF4110 domain-containing protein n=1 Tax=Rhodocollybia butyracea TaxID=206335 RepID=A0A9P5QAB5_9AGAR|nr:hypothetical protein BDP27DRAFT_1388596 [Rhodocollybia butyracea]
MAKKKPAGSKLSAKAAKKAKAAQKVERKETKKVKGKGNKYDDEEDLEAILEQIRQEWEAAHSVTEELVEGPPSRRVNGTLTACPSGNFLWFIGGEFFSEDGKAYFYNDVFRYSPEKDEWRKFVSPTCPGPRSAHAIAVTPAGGGKLFIFGGEFSSQNQTTFYHYRDFWCFDISTHTWDRIETKIRPTARSGHRMAAWKHYIVLFGGFYDPGFTTRYLNDLWIFDTQEYKWRPIEFKPNEIRPSPRSGFSFLSTPEGILLHGGYCKEYVKGKRPIGIMLEDTWVLKMSLPDPTAGEGSVTSPVTKKNAAAAADPLVVKWERRKRPSTAYAPALRSGCTMTAWLPKEMAVMFGGVTDEDTNEETLESVFWNDLNGYHWTGKGRWVSMTLRKPKKKAGGKKKSVAIPNTKYSDDEDDDVPKTPMKPMAPSAVTTNRIIGDGIDPDDPTLTIPLPRYNAMLSVLRNTLYIYGGIFERGSREYTLDDFHSIQLDKMERFVCLKESGIIIGEGDDESDEEDNDNDEDGDSDDSDETYYDRDDEGIPDEEGEENDHDHDHDEEEEEDDDDMDKQKIKFKTASTVKLEENDLASQAVAFMGVSKDTARSPEEVLSTPLPGETLAMFYARSRDYWSQRAFDNSGESRGIDKQLRTAGFTLAQERYAEYKPILKQVEKMLAEAGLDEDEMRRSASGAGQDAGGGQSRNRR